MAGTNLPLLATFQKHIEDMRNLTLCKICIKPFYEPFILPCGHTYCYSCLASWFGGPHGRRKKTCPDCRVKVTTEPCPNYLLRDLVHMFISRAELLPEDETTQEHEKAKGEEAAVLAADRAGLGLFKGVLKDGGRRRWGRGILDPEDGVLRCPTCHWEIEDGECLRCGFVEYEFRDTDDSESDFDSMGSQSIDTELDGEDEDLDDEFHHTMHNHALASFADYPSTEGSDWYDDYNEMEGFIEHDHPRLDGLEYDDDETNSESTMTLHRRAGMLDDDDLNERSFAPYGEEPRSPTSTSQSDADDGLDSPQLSDEDDDDESLAMTRDSEAGTMYDESDEEETYHAPVSSSSRARRIVISDDEEEDEEEDEDQDGRATSENVGSGDSSEDDNSTSVESETHVGGQDEEDDSDDSDIRPPQSSARRRQHLQSQRARRNNNITEMPAETQSRRSPQRSSHGQKTHVRQRGTMSQSSSTVSRDGGHHGYNNPAQGRRIAVGGRSEYL